MKIGAYPMKGLFDRAIKLAREVGIQPLDIWTKLKSEANEYYTPADTALWSTRYGMVSKGDKPIYVPVRQIPPAYPSSLLARGIEGCVMLRFDISKEGNPSNIEVDWSTNKKFNRSAIKSAKDYLFSPPYEGGKPSDVKDAQTLIVYKVDSKKSRSPSYTPPGCE